MEYSEDKRQHIKWEIESLESAIDVANKTIDDLNMRQEIIKGHQQNIEKLKLNLK